MTHRLSILTLIWSAQPKLRLGQLLVNAMVKPEGAITENDLFNISDDELFDKLVAYHNRCKEAHDKKECAPRYVPKKEVDSN